MTNAEAWFNSSLRPRKPEDSLGRTAQDGHLDSHTAPELCFVALEAIDISEGDRWGLDCCVRVVSGPTKQEGKLETCSALRQQYSSLFVLATDGLNTRRAPLTPASRSLLCSGSVRKSCN